jgi:D-serine deaminase-like pyridoxal phosphate-dependent protein
MENWYTLYNVAQLDTPAIVIYPDRVQENIQRLAASIDNILRLRPHIKTHKSGEVTRMLLDAGIRKVKCATIAEAEMLAEAGMPDVLLAYQPVGPKADRLQQLVLKFPLTDFSCLIDNMESATAIDTIFKKHHSSLNVLIDLNVGMNRTGIRPADAVKLWEQCQSLTNISLVGLHAYDGHLRDADFELRTRRCDESFAEVLQLQNTIATKSNKKLTIVAGGTPTYPIHSKRKEVECSPGTFIYWDAGYGKVLQEQNYLHAAVIVTRVISKPANDLICIDLGHKAIASENPLNQRICFLNVDQVEVVGHSEEHMVLKTDGASSLKPGDVLYGVPYHICPTVALHDRVFVAEARHINGFWEMPARNRYITA